MIRGRLWLKGGLGHGSCQKGTNHSKRYIKTTSVFFCQAAFYDWDRPVNSYPHPSFFTMFAAFVPAVLLVASMHHVAASSSANRLPSPLQHPRKITNGTTVPSRVEDGIQTECKTCPYKLCTNVAAYEYEHETTLTCWTRGDSIVDTKYVL